MVISFVKVGTNSDFSRKNTKYKKMINQALSKKRLLLFNKYHYNKNQAYTQMKYLQNTYMKKTSVQNL